MMSGANKTWGTSFSKVPVGLATGITGAIAAITTLAAATNLMLASEMGFIASIPATTAPTPLVKGTIHHLLMRGIPSRRGLLGITGPTAITIVAIAISLASASGKIRGRDRRSIRTGIIRVRLRTVFD